MWYDGTRRGGYTLPFAFAEAPHVTVVLIEGSFVPTQVNDTTTTKTCTYWVCSMEKYYNLTGVVEVKVEGRWK